MIFERFGRLLLCAGLMTAGFVGHADENQAVGKEKDTRKSYAPDDLRKMISVVKAKKAPVVDGIMEKSEWDDAVRITGLVKAGWAGQPGVQGNIEHITRMENIANDQSAFWISYDDENLYVAHLSPPPANIRDNPAIIQVMLKKNQTLHDSNIDFDDSIDIEFMSPVCPGGDNYIIQINSIGTVFDCIWEGEKGKMKGITVGWESGVVSKSTLTLDGWTVEAAIPWKNLEPNIPKPAPGDVKHMNFARLWREIIEESHAWQGCDGYRPKGEVLFTGDEGIVVQLYDTGNLPRGKAVFAAQIKNLFNSDKKIVAEVSTDSGELKDKKEMMLKPGGSAPYSFTGMIADFATTKIAFTVTDAETGKAVHVTTLPVIRPTKPDIFIRRYRSKEIMKFETDISFIGAADLKKTSIALTVADKATGKQIFTKAFDGFISHQTVLELSTKGWIPGDYEAHLVISAPGMKPYETTVSCEYPPLPEWWNNRLGYEDMDNDMVPFPWTDMKVAEGTVGAWGRDYCFGKRLMPEQISTLGYPILRAPIGLSLKVAGGESIDTSTLESKGEWTKTSRTRVEGKRVVDGKDVSIENTLWVEYDGFMWYTLKVAPRKKIEIADMELVIPLSKEFTDVINPMDYSLRTTGKLKPEGYSGPPTRPIWLGNGDGGIQWLNGADNKFFVQDPMKIIRVENGNEGAVLRIVMIDKPTALDTPYEVQFGIIATPVRPKLTRTPYFKERSISGGGPWFPKGMEFMAAPDPGSDFYSGGSKGGRIYAHTTPINVSPDAMALDALGENGYLFADDFRANPAERSFMVVTDHRSQAARDYYVWRHWCYQKKYGFAGIYYDSPSGVMLGLRNVMKRLYNITLRNNFYAGRDMAIGLHSSAMFDMSAGGFASYNWDGENYNSIINETQQTYRGTIDPARYRAQHMGHNFGWPIMFLGQGRIKREWVDANGGPEAVFDQIYGLNLIHDGLCVCCILPGVTRELQDRRQKDVKDFGLAHWIYQFTPYWRQDIVRLPKDKMYASFYIARPSLLKAGDDVNGWYHNQAFQNYFGDKHLPAYMRGVMFADTAKERAELENTDDKAVMIVYNDSEYSGEMRLKPDWQKLGLGTPEQLTAKNYLHCTGFRIEKVRNEKGEEVEKGVFFPRPEETARIENGEVIFPMTPFNYRMIVLEKLP